ncbi:MAG: ShlB/FhaC/HecB family hemolysin secretion/activation protein [Cyanomargarita calcarea GSE-NOS-MK-12-04C]|uniref:ShlB/FhaC/HecB family hemolysin secretion/activation protein n=1 Tax=Cyanomargarita calcarea GSE-NOS-MK-12-04C TaxID=2839659 RepID=A0A951QTH5_9CYAN|nr:ShlB/FhaC/HecB family hemolysin secretion/activation protein [Cyanomargarita calcarea GSE-NOS-MK-12-04C]
MSHDFLHLSRSYRYWYCLGLIAIANLTQVEILHAQVINTTPTVPNPNIRENQPPSTQPLPEPSPPSRLPPPEELLPNITPSSPEEAPPGEIPQTIVVKKFNVTGSTVFSPEDFAKITEPYIKKPITLAELFQIRGLITKLYVDKGYITSGAFIPPQKLQAGVVEIRVIEGGLEDIKITGTRRLNPGYVRSRIAIATGKPLNRDRLLEALQILQLNPLIENLTAELAAGSSPGGSLLEIRVREALTFNTQLVLDNGRSPSVGSFRRQIQISEANLLGLGDDINAIYTNTDGSNSLDLGYTLPINARNGTIAFNYGTSDSNVIERPFNVLDIESNSHYYELTLRQPIVQTPTQEFALGVTGTRRESQANYLEDKIAFPALGADNNGNTRVTALRFFQDWTSRSSRDVFALRSQFSIGLGALDSTINETSPDSRFYTWRGQAQWVRLLAPDTLLLLRGDMQLADRPLVAIEQIGLGGLETVRGYRQDALLTDNAIFASAEIRVPIARNQRNNTLLQLTPFLDFGTAWNRSGRPDSVNRDLGSNTLVSLGLGLRFQLQDRLTVRFDWGIPLISISGEKNSWQENGLYFSIVGNPF